MPELRESRARCRAGAADDQAGDVVVLGGVADEIVEAVHDAGERGGRALGTAGLENVEQARFPELVAVFVAGFGHTVGINHQEIVHLQVSDAGFVFFGQLDAERNAFGMEALDGTVVAQKHGRIMAGREIDEFAGRRIEFGEKRGGEAAAVEIIGAGETIQPGDEFGERAGRAGQSAEAGLKVGHEHGRGNAFAADVGDGNEQRAVSGAAEGVIVVASNGVGGTSGEGHVHARNVGRNARDKKALDFAGDFDVALHGDVIAKDHNKQTEQAEESGEKENFLGDEKSDAGDRDDGESYRDHQKNTAGGREFFQNAEEEGAQNTEGLRPGFSLGIDAMFEVLFVKAGADVRVGFELLPKLIDFHALSEAMPAVFGLPPGATREKFCAGPSAAELFRLRVESARRAWGNDGLVGRGHWRATR